MNNTWELELKRFSAMTDTNKIIWLSAMLFYWSMHARDTYQIGTHHVDRADDLREYNELLHRIASFQLQVAVGEAQRMPDEQLFLMLSDASAKLSINVKSLLDKVKKLGNKK